MADWKQACSLTALEEKGVWVWRMKEKQLALFLVEGDIFAIDNRCPHQGYPLSQGTLDDERCTLTCQWHNWKFDLRDGKELFGGDGVRTYPTRVKEGKIWIDLREPTPEERRSEILEELRDAVDRHQSGRIARCLARFQVHGLDPKDAIRAVLQWKMEHWEFGMNHACAVTADWLRLYDEWEGDPVQQNICLSEAIDYIAFETLRHPTYSFGEDVLPFAGEALLDAIEREGAGEVFALLRGALYAKVAWQDLEYWFSRAALAHYNDFGHALIYVQKVSELVEQLGEDVLPALLFPLAKSLVLATREDLLPEFQRYAEFFAKMPSAVCFPESPWVPVFRGSPSEKRSQVPKMREVSTEKSPAKRNLLHKATSASKEAHEDWQVALAQSPYDVEPLVTMTPNAAMEWVLLQTQESTIPAIFSALLEVSSHHLLHFDTSYQEAFDRPVKQSVGWLHLTHALTFANAVRTQCQKFPSLWRAGLLQMACFVGRNKGFVLQDLATEPWMMAGGFEVFWAEKREALLDHGEGVPIFAAHRIKTSLAVRDEWKWVRSSCRRWMLAALRRYLDSPLKQKHTRRRALQSLALVGKDRILETSSDGEGA